MLFRGACLLHLLPVFNCIPVAAAATEPASISFYECLRCDPPPVIDGTLDDACWQVLTPMEDFYKYWSPTPQPPPLRTSAKACYDSDGFYMGITLHEENLDKIRATISNRDHPLTWTDDCVEIMIDPDNSGTGYLKFVTNALEARYDEKATNMVLDGGWNVEGWKVKTSRATDAWYIEFFVPWSDIGVQPAEGDIWSFDLVRYGYSTGSFRGVTWSLGGSGAHPQQFGYLGFGRFTPPADAMLNKMARVFAKTKGDAFRLLLPGIVLTHEACGKWTRQELRAWAMESIEAVAREMQEVEAAITALAADADRDRLHARQQQARKKYNDLQARLDPAQQSTPSVASVVRQSAIMLLREVADLKWEAMLMALIGSA